MFGFSDPWASAREHFDLKVLPVLRQRGKDIGAAAAAGDAIAKAVVDRYTMLAQSFDPMTAILTEDALKEWLGLERARAA